MSSSAAFWACTSPRMVSSSSRVPSSSPLPLFCVSPQRTMMMRPATLSELYGGPGICTCIWVSFMALNSSNSVLSAWFGQCESSFQVPSRRPLPLFCVSP